MKKILLVFAPQSSAQHGEVEKLGQAAEAARPSLKRVLETAFLGQDHTCLVTAVRLYSTALEKDVPAALFEVEDLIAPIALESSP